MNRFWKELYKRHESCKGCIYQFSYGNEKVGCGYCYYTGEPRGCPAEQCSRKKTEGRPKNWDYGDFSYGDVFDDY